jgi:hypothetical protein
MTKTVSSTDQPGTPVGVALGFVEQIDFKEIAQLQVRLKRIMYGFEDPVK